MSCNVTFWKDTDDSKGTGLYKNYDSPHNETDLNEVQWQGQTHDDMKDDISWVDTDTQAWVKIYSKANYQGRYYLIGPGTSTNLKLVYVDGDDMNDTVESFQIFDHKPDVDTSAVNSNFVALYPGSTRTRVNNLYCSEFYAQDTQYRVYDPEMVLSDSGIAFTTQLDHVQSEHDDHATVTFSMDFTGTFIDQIAVSYDMADASQIPPWAVKLIDGAIDVAADAAKAVADGAEIVITDGVGVVATVETDELIQDAADALAFCVDHLNTVLSAIFKLQDNGGTMYFSSVVSHSIARLVLAYYQELFGTDNNRKLTFNEQSFLTPLGATGWINPGDSGGKSNPYVNFTQSSYSYRAFYPDNSFLYATGGAVSSVLVGATTDDQKDDHLNLQATFDPHGNLFSVAGGVDIFLMSVPDGYQAPTSGVIAYNQSRQLVHILPGSSAMVIDYSSIEDAYRDIMSTALNDAGVTLTDQQRYLVDASVTVLNAMTSAIA
ncbi:MAG TPA: hypothetical protein VEW03_01630 [Longimicrobiaceae bacterium]|nr:hypothetical protein [Longimicrobiaceae bacterium]